MEKEAKTHNESLRKLKVFLQKPSENQEEKINLLLCSLEHWFQPWFVTLQDVPNYLNDCHETFQSILEMKLVSFHLKIDGQPLFKE